MGKQPRKNIGKREEKKNLIRTALAWQQVVLQTFGKSKGKENAEVEKLRRTEELFRKALQNAGVNYAAEELTRVNSEKTHVSEENGTKSVDESGELRYNDGEVQHSAKIVKYIPYSKVG